MLPGEGATTTVDAAAVAVVICRCCPLCIPCVCRVDGPIAGFGVSRVVVCTTARSVLLPAAVVFELNLSMLFFRDRLLIGTRFEVLQSNTHANVWIYC